MKTQREALVKQDAMEPKELAELLTDLKPFLQPGKAYLFTMGFGWGYVGYFVRMETPLDYRLAHASYFRRAAMPYSELARTGGNSETAWEYVGDKLLSVTAKISIDPFAGPVPRGAVQHG